MICFSTHTQYQRANISLSPSHVTRQTHTHKHTLSVKPHGGQNDLVEQVVVELLSHFEAGPLHSYGGGQTQDDTQAAQHAEHRQIPRVTEDTALQRKRERQG